MYDVCNQWLQIIRLYLCYRPSVLDVQLAKGIQEWSLWLYSLFRCYWLFFLKLTGLPGTLQATSMAVIYYTIRSGRTHSPSFSLLSAYVWSFIYSIITVQGLMFVKKKNAGRREVAEWKWGAKNCHHRGCNSFSGYIFTLIYLLWHWQIKKAYCICVLYFFLSTPASI